MIILIRRDDIPYSFAIQHHNYALLGCAMCHTSKTINIDTILVFTRLLCDCSDEVKETLLRKRRQTCQQALSELRRRLTEDRVVVCSSPVISTLDYYTQFCWDQPIVCSSRTLEPADTRPAAMLISTDREGMERQRRDIRAIFRQLMVLEVCTQSHRYPKRVPSKNLD